MEILEELEGKDIYIGCYEAGGRHFWLDNLKLRAEAPKGKRKRQPKERRSNRHCLSSDGTTLQLKARTKIHAFFFA